VTPPALVYDVRTVPTASQAIARGTGNATPTSHAHYVHVL